MSWSGQTMISRPLSSVTLWMPGGTPGAAAASILGPRSSSAGGSGNSRPTISAASSRTASTAIAAFSFWPVL